MSKLPNYTPLLLIMTLFACNSLPDGSNNNNSKEGKIAKKEQLYKHLQEIGDVNSSIYVLHQILQLDSTRTEYYDSLAYHYREVRNIEAAAQMADKALKFGKNIKLLELSAATDIASGDYESAVTKLDELFKESQDFKYVFEIASIRLNQGDVAQGEKMLDELLANPKIESSFIEQTGSERIQLVPLRAAIYSLKATVAAQINRDYASANAYVDKALAIKPDFEAALYLKNQLRSVK